MTASAGSKLLGSAAATDDDWARCPGARCEKPHCSPFRHRPAAKNLHGSAGRSRLAADVAENAEGPGEAEFSRAVGTDTAVSFVTAVGFFEVIGFIEGTIAEKVEADSEKR